MPFEAIQICAKGEVEEAAEAFSATHLLSLLDPGDRVRTPSGLTREHHKTLWFKDSEMARDILGPTLAHIKQIDAWADELPQDSRLLINCFAGIGRSTAVALGLLSKALPPHQAMSTLLKLRPQATPNLVIVSHWDDLLGHKGKLLKAVHASCATRVRYD